MFARITRLQFPAARIEDAITSFRDETVPGVKELAGFVGAVLLVNRESGDAMAVTQWENREALEASEDAGKHLRQRAADNGGGTVVGVARFESAVIERSGPPRAGAAVRLTRGRASKDKLDALVASVRSEAVPMLRSMSGFRALIMGIDRESGDFTISSSFASAREREDSNAGIDEIRRRAFAAADVKNVEVMLYEGAVVDMPALAETS